jgi:hypothetical protein
MMLIFATERLLLLLVTHNLDDIVAYFLLLRESEGKTK